MHKAQERIRELLDIAGITINGPAPWDITVKDDRFFNRVLAGGSLALGESYMDGWWEADQLDEFFTRILRVHLDERFKYNLRFVFDVLLAKLINLQSPQRATIVGKKHYDLGNDLFQQMLDSGMVYSCGYWHHANSLDAAQEAKFALICRKIGLEPGMKLLDVGCGWGGFAKYAATNCHAEVTGITISAEQAKLAQKVCAGLPVDIRLQDYRSLDQKFDRIVSVGMFEHVGPRNYRTYMQKMRQLLRDDGLFLLHTIGGNRPSATNDKWIIKYIFPNSVIPSLSQIACASEKVFVMEDWHNFGVCYDTTLMAWYQNFITSWPNLQSQYDERFFRMWKYYLLLCAGSFRSRHTHLWQMVFSPHGIQGGYESKRESVYINTFQVRQSAQPVKRKYHHADHRTMHSPPI